MKWFAACTFIASMVLSAATAFWVVRHNIANPNSVVRTGNIELVDKQGVVRGTFGLVEIDGHEQPQILFKGEGGKDSIIISVNNLGQGTIYFDSTDKEGKVALGYIWGSDVTSKDQADPLAFWGIRVLGKNGQNMSVGLGEKDRIFSPNR